MDPGGTISTDQTDFFGNRTRFGARGLNAENVLVLMSSEQVKIYMAIRRKRVGRNLKVNVIRYFPEKEGMVSANSAVSLATFTRWCLVGRCDTTVL